MKALVLTAPNEPLVIMDVEKPSPGHGQLLVRSVAAALNPVDSLMRSTGLLIISFPVALGCDASGEVVAVGEGVEGFKIGDRVCGCTRLGSPGHGTWGEYFLMDAPLTIPTPKNISFEQAATLGVGSYTASLGLFEGLNIPPDHPTSNPEPKDEWVIVFGGAGSVGQYAVQLAKTCGYKVLASCSEGGEELLKSLSATATLNHTLDHANQLAAIRSLTGGNFSRVFDAAGYSYPLAAKALSEISTAAGPKYFTTTDDWSPLDEIPGTKTHRITLGPIGREGEEKLHENIKKYIPVIKTLVEEGTVFTNGVEVLGEGGIEGLKGVLEKGEKGEKGKKGVVMVGGV